MSTDTLARAVTLDTVEDAQRLLDSLDGPRCQYEIGTPCTRPAAHLLVVSCGHDAALCDHHKTAVAAAVVGKPSFFCSKTERPEHEPRKLVSLSWRAL